jgi:hypothetical protein
VRPWPERAAFALLLIALMMRWAEDPGRTDIAVAALLGVAALAVLAGRPIAAALAVAVALFVHETGFVFGLPLLAGLWLDQGRWRAIGRRASVGVGAVLGLALLLYLAFDRLPRADARRWSRSCAATFRARVRRLGDLLRGQRRARRADVAVPERRRSDLRAARRRRAARDRLFIAILKRRGAPGWPAVLLVSVPPFLFLSVVANDISRWAVLAAFNVWLLCAAVAGGVRPRRVASGRHAAPRPRRPGRRGVGLARRAGGAADSADPSEDLADRGPDLRADAGARAPRTPTRRAGDAALRRGSGALRSGLAQRARRRSRHASSALRAPSATRLCITAALKSSGRRN